MGQTHWDITISGAGAITGTAMAWYAIFNGFGRIVWGALSDRIGRKKAIVAMTMLQGLVMLLLYHVFIYYGVSTGFVIGVSIIGFNFGGNFALFPAATADFFGTKNIGSNYGWIFTAYGIAGILGPQMAGLFKDAAEGSAEPVVWMAPFIIAGVACLAGAMVMAMTNPPEKFAA